MNKSDSMLKRLGECDARVENPEALTDFIMAGLPEERSAQTARPRRTMAGLIGALSGMAALWLVGLFIYQTADTYIKVRACTTAVPAPREEYSGGTLELLCKRGESRNNALSYLQLKHGYNNEK